MKRWIIILMLMLLLAIAYGILTGQDRDQAVREARASADSAQQARAARDSIKMVVEALASRYDADTAQDGALIADLRGIIARHKPTIIYRDNGRVDTIPGEPVTFTELAAAAEAAVAACEVSKHTCEERVAALQALADTAGVEAQHWQNAAEKWESIARGPFFRPAVEVTTNLDWQPEAAFDLTLGRGRLKALGRIVVREGPESCDFGASSNTYACSTKWDGEGRLGVRYSF